MLEIRFTQAARKHRIGRASVRHVMSTVIPAGIVTTQGSQAWIYIGADERGRELEVIAVEIGQRQGQRHTCWSSTPCPRACGRGTAMSRRPPPRINRDTPIGPDVDLDQEDVRLANGTRLTTEIATQIVQDARRAVGRPSLTGPGKHSPHVSARVSPELRDAAERQARREGKSVSQLIRELLERYLAGKPGVRG
jgi:hypothetical protein